ncbi:aryl-alcohol dehydrogenase-like predicted oxidoreductase [Conyzicola lurida]|uniref:Aryl-alcohol dehydrogenase-like predicted oxidoreductase n=1 Tax=Conyzicola lurida TaxID=1172621 RepID=A0A841AQN2_9MICO|nr:aldo/keto reductase [Conyzicola lurida]MBB5843885.1 aryl-alcohol dehydrogenase-like predicted oxidoreductase [Conyzicola lurida]
MTRIGTSDLDVFPLALGGNTFGWTSDAAESHAVLDAFTAAGGNFVDTADGYSSWVPGNSGGESETIIGSWFAKNGNRDAVVLGTKVSQHPDFRGLSAATVAAAADASLARLGTDYIDLYYAHFDDAETPLEETASAFNDLVVAGKVRYIAVSNYTADRVAEWFAIAEKNGFALPVALQPHYNLVHREPFESEFGPIVAEKQLGVVPYYALASGFLTGKYRSADDYGKSPRGQGAAAYLNETGLGVLAALEDAASAHGVAVASVALAWLRTRQGIVAPLASARTTEQLPDLLASATLELTADEIAALDAASAK